MLLGSGRSSTSPLPSRVSRTIRQPCVWNARISLLYSFFNHLVSQVCVNLMISETLRASSPGLALGTYSMLRVFNMLISGAP